MLINKTNNKDKQRENLAGKLQGLLQNLDKLAPHPDRPHQKGPQFLHHHARTKPTADYDSMLGGMLMDSFLGGAFTLAASDALDGWIPHSWNNWITTIDWDKAADIGSHYMEDREKGRVQIGQRNVIANDFNKLGSAEKRDILMTAWLEDLPQRLSIERQIAGILKNLDALDAHQYTRTELCEIFHNTPMAA